MTDKKMTVIRLVIYYILAIIPMFIVAAYCESKLGADFFDTKGKESLPMLVTAILGLGMCAPSFANVITRLVTKEGFADTMLDISFRDRKFRYYLIALTAPFAMGFIGILLTSTAFEGGLSGTEIFRTELETEYCIMIPYAMGNILIMIFPYFGEEFGWRAYMMPRLEKIMPENAAMVVGGVLWGLWHAPLTCHGHDFGMDYPFFPYLGIILMCVFCIFTGMLLWYITKKTGSVFPAAIAHGAINSANVMQVFFSDEFIEKMTALNVFDMFIRYSSPWVMAGIIFFVIITVKKRKSA